MGNPEEIPNIEEFPILPRERAIEDKVPDMRPMGTGRPLTPMQRANVEFWNLGESASITSKPSPAKASRLTHSKRADRIGIVMAIIAMCIVMMIAVMVRVSRRNPAPALAGPSLKKTISPTIDFYLGNRAFDEKVKREKDHTPDVTPMDNGPDLQVSLQDQMSSMHEKLEKMRSEKTREEPPAPLPDRGDLPAQLIQVNPVDVPSNFDTPAVFLENLPKSLQQDPSETR